MLLSRHRRNKHIRFLMSCCFISFSGIILQIDSDQPITVEESCRPFLTEPEKPRVHAVFSCVDSLSYQRGREVQRGLVWRYCRDDSGTTFRLFYAQPDSPEPYACAVWDREGRAIRVEYLSRENSRVSSLMNCFFYLGMEQVLIRHDRLWPHAACVETEFGGILFSGVSGIGKSTQAELWCRCRNARQINGDRPILSRSEEGWLAWGAPYAGSSRCYVNDCCKVSAIVMLRQEKQCSLRRLSLSEAFREVWKGLALYSWDRDFMERASDLTMDLVANVPVFTFGCTPDEAAVDYLERELQNEWNK